MIHVKYQALFSPKLNEESHFNCHLLYIINSGFPFHCCHIHYIASLTEIAVGQIHQANSEDKMYHLCLSFGFE